MAEFVNITFNQDLAERFKNTIGGGPTAANNLDRVVIDPSEVFDGDGSGRWDNNSATFMQIATDSRFTFGDGLNRYMKLSFMLLNNGRYGLVGRRGDQNNRWHLILDTSTPATPTIEFFANDSGTTAHNLSFDFSGLIPTLTLGRWHTIEVSFALGVLRFWIDGVYLTSSTDPNGTPLIVDAGNAVVEVGRVNQATVASPTDFVTFDRYIDTISFHDSIPSTPPDLTSNVDHYIRTWTGNTERLELFGSAKTVQPGILDQTAFPNNIADFELASNQCFIAGIEPMRKVDDQTILDVGMSNPPNITFTGGSAGSNYDYVMTWVDARGNESGPSAISSQRSTTSNTIQRGSPPSQAAFWRVYRRHASAGQGLHYLVSPDIAIASSTWAEAGSIESLSIIAPLQGVGVPPVSNHIAYNAGRMFYGNVKLAGGDRYPTRVYFSQINSLEQVGPNDWFYVGDDDSEIITGMVRFRGNLIIFKERSMYAAIGDPSDPGFQIVDISRSVGCVAHQTIREAGNRLIWQDDEGIYSWRGDAEPLLISEFIEPFFENMPDSRKPFATAAVDHELGLYLLSLSLEQDDENDFILCYNFRDSFQDNVHRWTRWTVPVSSLGDGYVGTGRDARAFFADKVGKVGQFERGLDLNAGIDFTWKTGRFNPYNLGSSMHLHYATMMIDLVGAGTRRISVGYEINEAGEELQVFESPTENNFKIRIASRGEYLSLVAKGTDIRERIRIYGFNVDGSAIGKR